MPPLWLGSPIQVASRVITPDLPHSEVTENDADVVFVSGAGVRMVLVGFQGRCIPPYPPATRFQTQSTDAGEKRLEKQACGWDAPHRSGVTYVTLSR